MQKSNTISKGIFVGIITLSFIYSPAVVSAQTAGSGQLSNLSNIIQNLLSTVSDLSSQISSLSTGSQLAQVGGGTNLFSWGLETPNPANQTVLNYDGGTSRTTTDAHTGNYSMRLNVAGNDNGNQQMGAELWPPISTPFNIVGAPAIYYRWWMKIDPSFTWGTPYSRAKSSRVNGTNYPRVYTGYVMVDGFNIGECEDVGSAQPGGGCNDPGPIIPYDMRQMNDGQWHEYIVMVKANSTAGSSDAQFKVWIDGNLIGQKLNFPLHNKSSNGHIEAWAGWMVRPYFQLGATAADGGTIYLDDFSTDTVWNSTYSGGGGTPPPTPSPSTKFSLNDRIQTTDTLNIRQTPNGTLLGSQTQGQIGTVIGGPANAGGFNWWQVNFDSGFDGWAAEDWMVDYTSTTPPSTNPIALYAFEEGSGTSVGDSAGSNNGTANGPTWTTGRIGKALNFDGSNDYVSVNSSSLNITGDLTVAAWINRDATGGAHVVAGKGDCYNNNCPYSLRISGDGKVNFDQNNGASGQDTFSSNVSTPANTWTHVAIVRSGNTRSIYINGVLDNGPVTYSRVGASNSAAFVIGDTAPGGGAPFDGSIDDVRIYNRALPTTEIQGLFAGSGTPTPTQCTYQYSNWSTCSSNNLQTRTVTSATPNGCVGTPVTQQSCTYVPPSGGSANLIFSHDFENGTWGGLNHGASGGDSDRTSIEQCGTGNSNYCARVNYSNGQNLNKIWLTGINNSYNRELFIRFKSKYSSDFVFQYNHKMMRLTNGGSTFSVNNEFLAGGAFLSNGTMTFQKHNCSGSSQSGTPGGPVYYNVPDHQRGVWYERIYHIKLNSKGNNDGFVKYYQRRTTDAPIDLANPTAQSLNMQHVVTSPPNSGYCNFDPLSLTNKWNTIWLPDNAADSGTIGSYYIDEIEVWDGVPSGTTPSPSTKFSLNDRIQTTDTLNIRQTPNGTLLGSQTQGQIGTVIGGPANAGGFNWWQVNFDSGFDGWAAEDWMSDYTQPTPTQCTYQYSNWSTCSSNDTQTRTVTSATPQGCVGTPVTTQSCTYVPPTTPPAGSMNLDFSTFIGGSQFDSIRDTAVDVQGNIYITGGTQSPNFPTTSGAYQRTHNSSGNMDVFVMKFSPSGNLIWSTLFGGPNYDRAYAIDVDSQGNVYIAGRAGSGLPVTSGSFQPNFQGGVESFYGAQDGFIAKFNPNGTSLLWGSYFGTSDFRIVRDLEVDQSGNVYIASAYSSGTYVSSVRNAFVNSPLGGTDAVIAKVSTDGSQVLWARYLGGSGLEYNENSVRIDGSGNPYFIFTTQSAGIATPGSFDTSYGGNEDILVSRLNPNNGSLVWSGYVGGSGNESTETHELAVDLQGNVYVGGPTKSTNFPTTSGALQRNFGGVHDMFVTKISPDGSQRLASTYIGGSDADRIEGMDVDSSGNVYFTGVTSSTNFPITNDAYQKTKSGSQGDAVAVVLSSDLTQLLYSSHLGGTNIEHGRGATVDNNGNFIIIGDTLSSNFPTKNAYQSNYSGGNADGLFARFSPSGTTPTPTPDTTAPTVPANLTGSAISSSQVTINWNTSTDPTTILGTTSGVAGYNVYRNGTKIDTTSVTNYTDSGLSANTTYTYKVSAYDNAGNTSTQSAGRNVTTQSPTPTQCTYQYSNWSTCSSNNTQTRTVTSATPNGCTGTPVTSQSCTYVPPSSNTNLFNWGLETPNPANQTVLNYDGGTSRTTTDAHTGNYSMRLNVAGNDNGNQQMGADLWPHISTPFNIVGGPAIYYRWWMKIDPSFSWGNQTAKTKSSRVGGTNYPRVYTGYVQANGFHIGECEDVGSAQPGGGCNGTGPTIYYDMRSKNDGQWHEYIIMVKANSTAGSSDAQFKVWIDNNLIGQNTNFPLHNKSSNGHIEGWAGWMVRPYFQLNGTASDGGIIYLDDFSTDTVWNSTYSGGGGTPPPTPSPSTKFSLNDRIQTTDTLNIRQTPNGTLLGSQTQGQIGTVIGGPANAGGFNWWQVNFDSGFDGWAAEDWMVDYTSTTPPSTNPIALYAFEEGSGTSVGDSAGSNNGTANGPTWTTGRIGKALNFDGSNDYVSVNSSSLNITGDLTVAAWINRDATGGAHVVAGKGDCYNNNCPYSLRISGDGKVNFDQNNGASGQDTFSSNVSTPANTWTHVAIVRSGNTRSIYINGVLDNGPVTYSRVGASNSAAFVIGDTAPGGGAPFDGSIDDVRIYNRALPTTEIQGLFAGSGTPTPTQCTYQYSNWSTCSSNNLQTRTVTSATPNGCVGTPVTTQSCTYNAPSTKFSLNDRIQTTDTLNIRQTPNGTLLGSQTQGQIGTVIGGPANAGGFNWWQVNFDSGFDGWAAEDWMVDYVVPTCTSFIYSNWNTCTNNTQNRVVISSSPVGCTGGSPVLTQSCTVTPTQCTYQYSNWSTCSSNNTQTRTVTSATPNGCTGTPVTSQSCTYVPPTTGENECTNWQTTHPEWIWCDDFEQSAPSVGTGRYFEVDTNSFTRVSGAGLNGSQGMEAHWNQGQVGAGGLKLGFGRNPSSYMDKGIKSTQNFRDIYYRTYIKTQAGWQGNPSKLSRATVISGSDWSQAMIAHLWGGSGNSLAIDPVSCTNSIGNVLCSGYNDFSNMQWLGLKNGPTQVYDSTHAGQWQCIESHVRLNDPGQSNGVQEFWVDGNLEVRSANLNFVDTYTDYGINAVFLENYWNNGSTKSQSRYMDNFVISTEPIGCSPSGGTIPPTPIPDTTAPTTPANLTGTANSSSQITINWNASTDPTTILGTTSGVAGYNVYRNNTKINTTTNTNYTDSGLSANTTYTYKISAFDNAGNTSGQSASRNVTTQSPPVTQCSYQYSNWGTCSSNNLQTRTVTSSTPAGCTGTPVTQQSCTYNAPSTKFSLNDRVQTTSTLNIRQTANGTLLGSQTQGSIGTVIGGPVSAGNYNWWQVNFDSGFDGWAAEDWMVDYVVPTCTSFIYSNWNTCTNSTQNRAVISSSPVGCTGGSPVLTQSCTVTPTQCTYQYSNWGTCSSNSLQTRTVTSTTPQGCVGTPTTQQSCTYVPPQSGECTYTYRDWSDCGSNNIQTRSVISATPEGCAGVPTITQSCNYVPPTQTGDTTAPTTPTGLTTQVISSTQIAFAWFPSSDDTGVIGYNIYRNGIKITTIPSTSYLDSGLQQGTTYTYTISAYDAAGNTSAQSGGSSATTAGTSDGGDGGGITPPLTPTQCSYNYTNWGTCSSNNTQSRTVTSSTPAGCTGTPVTSQSCTYVPPQTGDNKFNIGDRIVVSTGRSYLRVRDEEGRLRGSQRNNDKGTVIGGPVFLDGYNRWNIDFDSGRDGWVAEDFIIIEGFIPNSTKFTANDRIAVTTGSSSSLYVRDETGRLIGFQRPGTEGTVVGGPILQAGHIRWNIDFDSGRDGWVAEDFITKQAITPPSTKFIIGDTVTVNTGDNSVLRVRDANGTYIGFQRNGATGTVIEGPVLRSGYQRWNIDFANSTRDGWVAEDFIQ